ncbi:MAG: PDZ domain-containing protein [Myxococcales bacterium]|nr:PDZ domain-containing protein [Myxococcales bacterium]
MGARRHRQPLTLAAMVLGVLAGLALLALMRPGRVPEAPLSPQRPVPYEGRGVQVEPTPSPRRAARRAPAPTPPPSAQTPEPVVTGREDGPVSVVVDVVDADGRPVEDAFAMPVDCPGLVPDAERGRFVADPGPCTLRAGRRDGALIARGRPQTVELVAGEDAYVQLVLRNARTGGVGVRFQPAPGGMRVLQVVPNSAAWEAGLEEGDLIVGVEGVSTDRMPAEVFVDAMTGPEGSDVEFTVRYPSDEGVTDETVRVTRSFLDG